MGSEKRSATSLTASMVDRMEKGMVPEIISWPMAVRHQFVIREASIVNRPNNLTLSIPTFIVTSHCSAPLAPQPSQPCTPH